MSRAGRRRRQAPRRHARTREESREQRADEDDEGDLDGVEILADVRDLLLAGLRCQACGLCGGFGRVVEGRDPQGQPIVSRCPCRNEAAALVEQFGEEGE